MSPGSRTPRDRSAGLLRGRSVHPAPRGRIATPGEMVGRALKQLEAAGALTLSQGRAVVLDRERPRLLA